MHGEMTKMIKSHFPPLLLCSVRRSYERFESEIADCEEGRCTLMRCTVGPLAKDQNALFKIRSRLFTKTQVEVR